MYPITVPGLQATTTQALTQTDTSLYLDDVTKFDDAPNLCTIKKSQTEWEVCKYTAKTVTSGTAGYLTIVRSGDEHLSSAPNNAAIAFASAGVKVFRGFTGWDYGAIRNNISEHETRLAAAEASIASSMNPVVAALIFG